MSVPAVAVAGPVFVSARSATAVTVRFTVAVLFAATGSGVSLRTFATLLTSIPSFAEIVYVIVARPVVVVDALARFPRRQLSSWPPVTAVKVQPGVAPLIAGLVFETVNV